MGGGDGLPAIKETVDADLVKEMTIGRKKEIFILQSWQSIDFWLLVAQWPPSNP